MDSFLVWLVCMVVWFEGVRAIGHYLERPTKEARIAQTEQQTKELLERLHQHELEQWDRELSRWLMLKYGSAEAWRETWGQRVYDRSRQAMTANEWVIYNRTPYS